LRSAAQDDLVFVHATFTPAPGAPAYVIADVFRLDGCRIVEHWDVVAAPKPDMPNPNSRY
jgi:predicted SnoaL-like aldol condensation-catalyzing enzyme